ncbi:aspartyl/glutamyl-tRNA(Asn/Gln) amidotransferase subunit C [Thermaurantimonas aggregans]|uniref:Aspartyl/glutamyl-tRNA(Asn/Gln) amidotransferase subunit C n=1 Tax=Thermaurantimonas aggregans TaxID=2173829 RepID=A0A401XM68_9FLAO|nr:Asp-tRNA(Asn)/Glu-tRNA(Gln) amidotransferase subunit GatC [Thermaurantimonas aggregans]MCX8147990.1 Asp-tRNA(Asn)/Glu-tRNA(Gln) amidotransferase subunit GatC [Thermaurantimonas aggregans]GCD78119.1 aspartyl/glutamyl-tRNA(Asn/Gln) amidotransferase subunit C [Thermaurantimonas aggregans]
MKISKEEILKIAALAKLSLDEEQLTSMEADMNKILAFVEKINELPLEGIEPLEYVNEDTNVLRDDQVVYTVSQYDALKNAALKDTDYIKVPKVLG